jgi:integrase
MQEQEDAKGGIFAKKLASEGKTLEGETCDKWFGRYFAWCVEKGETAARDKRYRYNVWIHPRIGPKAMVAVTPDDIEDIRDALDDASREWLKQGRGPGRISGKTATEVWSVLVSGFRQASSSKRRELRIFPRGSRSPCEGIEPPDRGVARRKPFVYPSELLALLLCDDVPLEWRELHAIAAYTYVRPGELRVLQWKDVDVERCLMSVTKAWDYASKKVKAPKTRNGVRDVPLEPAIVPLLKRLRDRATSEDLVAPLLSQVNEDELAKITRKHLKSASVERSALHDDTTTTKAFGFRGWRDTGLTWLAIAGVDVVRMQRRAGHDDISTTMGYVKVAEDLGDTFGAPFPALPAVLVGTAIGGGDQPTVQPTELPRAVQAAAIIDESRCEGRDLNPYRSYPTRT